MGSCEVDLESIDDAITYLSDIGGITTLLVPFSFFSDNRPEADPCKAASPWT
ncbi:hypothetical protein [Rhodococcus sp. IEGM1428]|uniref:hypothetical protein n=1 Tax=Rhodococcus sp. IEGM1428 TaxID=3392191 RepID=UPI003D0E6089